MVDLLIYSQWVYEIPTGVAKNLRLSKPVDCGINVQGEQIFS